ncbi:hypothetical protein ElyMa_006843900 [Elysia marginata]|uniref:Reverse transcriptase domain-containing protein n=1 Tax=Elysia marginata TaxID=1093978 RepID=A0AAV4J8M8_9GAST|nr:hypothetical protein ElyMa_006843900 [Elysia marginata]
MEILAENYQDFFSKENVSNKAIQNTTPLLTMKELGAPPTIHELRTAIDTHSCGKIPRNNRISPKILKAGKENSPLGHLHELLLQCWDERTLTKDMRVAKIVILYIKGARGDCNNYCGISLLSTMVTNFARVVLNRIQQVAAGRVYPHSQC